MFYEKKFLNIELSKKLADIIKKDSASDSKFYY